MAKLVKLIRADLVTGINKVPSIADGTVTEITADDLQGATLIRDKFFEYCEELTTVVCPSSIKSIGKNTFNGCSKLTSVVLPKDIIEIENSTFNKCALTEITIPSAVEEIGSNAFTGNQLKKVIMLPTTPPQIQSYSFDKTIESIIVPKGSGDAYKTATNWSSFANIITEEDV